MRVIDEISTGGGFNSIPLLIFKRGKFNPNLDADDGFLVRFLLLFTVIEIMPVIKKTAIGAIIE
jgi:hypothetical protein